MLDKLLVCLRAKPMALSVSSSSFSAAEITALMRAGFVTSSVQGLNSANVFSVPQSGSSGTLTSISSVSKAASGSLAAIGGEGAIYVAGGRGGIRRSSSHLGNPSEQASSEAFAEGVELNLSLPGTGAYLKVRHLFMTSFPESSLYLITKYFWEVMLLFRLLYTSRNLPQNLFSEGTLTQDCAIALECCSFPSRLPCHEVEISGNFGLPTS